MIQQLLHINRSTNFLLACSGGVDSMAIASFYLNGGKNFKLAYFNHATVQANQMEEFCQGWAKENKVEIVFGKISFSKPKELSPEEHWRNERYAWLNSFGLPIITCHHLDDVVETWIFSCLHGNPKLISLRNGLVQRPFLLNEKQEFISWCTRHNVSWFEDKSNQDTNVPRNRIRHNIIPEALKINPGLKKVIKKKLIQEYQSCK